MKFIYLVFISLILTIGVSAYNEVEMMQEDYTGCYVCFHKNTYVRYKGTDTKEMRKKAYDIYKCKVYTAIDYCDVLTNKHGYTLIDGVLK